MDVVAPTGDDTDCRGSPIGAHGAADRHGPSAATHVAAAHETGTARPYHGQSFRRVRHSI